MIEENAMEAFKIRVNDEETLEVCKCEVTDNE
jgi:hypothetical protein